MTEQICYGDYTVDFPCKCGAPIDVYINWNNGDERPRCRNECKQFTIKWFCDKCNGDD